jgi:hypothetical protein
MSQNRGISLNVIRVVPGEDARRVTTFSHITVTLSGGSLGLL